MTYGGTSYGGGAYGGGGGAAAVAGARPVALEVHIEPQAPTESDDLTASYIYVDPADIAEDTSKRVIRWFRDSGSGFAHEDAYDDDLVISPITEVGDAWKFQLAVHNGTTKSVTYESPVTYIGDACQVIVRVDDGAAVYSDTIGLSGRGARRAEALTLPGAISGRMVDVEMSFTARTRPLGLRIPYTARKGSER